jgi:hypothetical protein
MSAIKQNLVVRFHAIAYHNASTADKFILPAVLKVGRPDTPLMMWVSLEFRDGISNPACNIFGLLSICALGYVYKARICKVLSQKIQLGTVSCLTL